MNQETYLQGGCACGRNHYIIRIPEDAEETPKVFFDTGAVHRRAHATPLSAWLRVPLSYFSSTTRAYMPDETPSSIRRTYTSPFEENTQRHFCGFCGTPLSYWCESPRDEADYISLTLGSLDSSYLRDLEDLGLLPKEAYEDNQNDRDTAEELSYFARSNDNNDGLPWFEAMVQGSRLGNMKRSWGQNQRSHGNSARIKIEWEICEWNDDGTTGETLAPAAKRKLDEVEEDNSMHVGH